MKLEKKRILVAMGGPSEESSISMKSGAAVLNALKNIGFNASGLEIRGDDPGQYFTEKLKEIKPDICFLALHGRFGEDGTAQDILSGLGIPYTGSGPDGSLRAFDKLMTKEIFIKNKILTPEYHSVKKGSSCRENRLVGYPLVVKPSCQGSTIGVGVVENENQFLPSLEEAFKYGDRVLVEKFIKGREMTVGVLRKEALPVIEIRPKHSIFNYHAKYHDPDTGYIVPAEIPPDIADEIKRLGLLAHMSLGLKDFSRMDLILGEDMSPYFLEANTIPGLSERSLFPRACKARGISFEEMCVILLKGALCRKN